LAERLQPRHFRLQHLRIIAVKAVGHDQDVCALRQHPARPLHVELAQNVTDAGAAGPVVDMRTDKLHRLIHIAALQLAGDVGQPVPNVNTCTRERSLVSACRKCRNTRE
jgi:hypothetical protein